MVGETAVEDKELTLKLEFNDSYENVQFVCESVYIHLKSKMPLSRIQILTVPASDAFKYDIIS